MEVIFVDYRQVEIIKAATHNWVWLIVNLDMAGIRSHLDNDIVNVKGELSQQKARVDPFPFV